MHCVFDKDFLQGCLFWRQILKCISLDHDSPYRQANEVEVFTYTHGKMKNENKEIIFIYEKILKF